MLCDSSSSPSAKRSACTSAPQCMHPHHSSGAVIASRKTGIADLLSGGVESSKGKRGAESSRRRWRQARQEETKQSDRAAVKLGSSVGIHRGCARRVAPRANSETRSTMSTPEDQMAAAVQQLNVRLQQQGTMATTLQAER